MVANLTTQQLSYLVAISEYDSYADAGKSLGVSAAAVSQGMSELQKRLGAKLVTNGRDGNKLTQTGEVAYQFAKQTLGATADLQDWIAGQNHGELGRLSVAMIDSAAISHFSDHIKAFRDSHQHVEFALSVCPSTESLQMLTDTKVDLAIVVGQHGLEDTFVVTPLVTENILVYGPGRSKDPTTWNPWLMFPSGSHTRTLVSGALARLGCPMIVNTTSHQPEVLAEMVQMGLGYAALPESQAVSHGTKLKPVANTPLASRTLVAATRKTQNNPLTKRFLEKLTSSPRAAIAR